MFHIHVYRAIDNSDLCEQFAEGHATVLTSYGISKLTTLDCSWMEDPNVYVIAVKDTISNEMVGGGRFHMTDLQTRTLLPLEKAIAPLEPNISPLIDQYIAKTGKKVSEICAIWNARKVSGKGLSTLTCRACVARSGLVLASQLGIGTSLVFCAPWTVKLFKSLGYTVETNIGNTGTFAYPKPDLLATLVAVHDVHTLADATKINRKQIDNLRHHPIQKKLEAYGSRQLKISYNLEL